MAPLVSIILPVYNRMQVVKTIKSVLCQTYKNYELIIIDNASTDNTVKEIEKINDKRIKLYVNSENRGQTYSLNRGLEIASGEYIARIDSDDLMYPERLEKQVLFMEANSDHVICGSNATLIDDDDKEFGVLSYCENNDNIVLGGTFFCPFAHPAVMIRADVVRKQKLFYDETYKIAEDYELWMRLLQYGKGFNFQEPLIYYRMGLNNDSLRYHDILKKESFKIRRRLIEQDQLSINKSEYKELLQCVELENKSLIEILRAYYMWYRYLNRNICKQDKDYKVLKKRLSDFIISSCVLDNNRKSVIFVHKIIHKIRKLLLK